MAPARAIRRVGRGGVSSARRDDARLLHLPRGTTRARTRATRDFHRLSHGESFIELLRTRSTRRASTASTSPRQRCRSPGRSRWSAPWPSSRRAARRCSARPTHRWLAALPGANLLEVGDWGMRRSTFEDLELVTHWRQLPRRADEVPPARHVPMREDVGVSDRMYVPRFNVMPDDEVRAFVSGRDRPARDRRGGRRPGGDVPAGAVARRPAGRSRGPRQPALAGHRRRFAGTRDRARPGRVREPGVLRDQARARPGGADLELLGGPPARPGHGPSTTRCGCASWSASSPTTTSPDAPTRGRSRTPPRYYIEKQLKAIVGVEMLVESVEAKAKLSQNRSDEDVAE